MPQQQESTKKKTLKSSSRSFWISTGLFLSNFISQPLLLAHNIFNSQALANSVDQHLLEQFDLVYTVYNIITGSYLEACVLYFLLSMLIEIF